MTTFTKPVVARRIATLGVVPLALVVSLSVAGCSSGQSAQEGDATATASPSASAPSQSPGSPPATRAEVRTFVEKAVAYAKANGKQAALQAFTQPGGEFHDGDLYIYAYDFNGTVIAHGGDPNLVGQNLINMKDPNGVPVIQELVALAKQGSGWLEYMWANPVDGNAVEPKLGFVMKVDDQWFLGSGTYPMQGGPSASAPAR